MLAEMMEMEHFKRPDYFRIHEKQFEVHNVVLPIYLERKNRNKRVMVNLILESSNKYIRAYFWRKPYLIKDVLSSRIEPLSIDFPLKEEGKIIIKEKVIQEVNLLLKRLKIKGEITNVYIGEVVRG